MTVAVADCFIKVDGTTVSAQALPKLEPEAVSTALAESVESSSESERGQSTGTGKHPISAAM